MRLTLVHVSALLPRCAQIGILANKGISATDIKKLRDAGLHTVADIQHTTTKKMLNIKGLSEAKVQKIKDVAKNESGNTFMSGSELRQKRESILKARRARARCCLLLPPPAAAAGSRHCCSYYNRCSVLTQPTHALCLAADQHGLLRLERAARRRHRDRLHHRGVWRVPYRQEPALTHTRRHYAALPGGRRRERQGPRD
jgi:hypothetical protein